MLIELGQFRCRQSVDALFNLITFDAHRFQLLLHILIIQHRQQLLPINLLLMFSNNLRRADHRSMCQRNLSYQKQVQSS